jgi:hypothetical protein
VEVPYGVSERYDRHTSEGFDRALVIVMVLRICECFSLWILIALHSSSTKALTWWAIYHTLRHVVEYLTEYQNDSAGI